MRVILLENLIGRFCEVVCVLGQVVSRVTSAFGFRRDACAFVQEKEHSPGKQLQPLSFLILRGNLSTR